jgi:D-gamma-glutamyl-meso-diaminopimelic acid endopeptidase CwlS
MQSRIALFFICWILPSCLSAQGIRDKDAEVYELRIEVEDLKHLLHTTQVELGLFDERLKKQAVSTAKGQENNSQVAALERKIAQLEKTLDKAAADLRTLNTSVHQAISKIQSLETDLISHDTRLDEVAKLKETLTSISKAMGVSVSTSNSKTYKVKAGDTLEKIAKSQGIAVGDLRKNNPQLKNDKIMIGQELRLSQ